MPDTQLFFYQDKNGHAPALEWLIKLRRRDGKAYAACLAKVRMLAAFGHELRRPTADLLRDGIYELRARRGRVNYRILYFFHGRDVAVLACGLTKEKEVPAAEIERVMTRKKRYEQDPQTHRAARSPEDL